MFSVHARDVGRYKTVRSAEKMMHSLPKRSPECGSRVSASATATKPETLSAARSSAGKVRTTRRASTKQDLGDGIVIAMRSPQTRPYRSTQGQAVMCAEMLAAAANGLAEAVILSRPTSTIAGESVVTLVSSLQSPGHRTLVYNEIMMNEKNHRPTELMALTRA
jgi:hypothetical protein